MGKGLLTTTPRGSVKSPLRYPGGKSRAVGTIMKCLPDDIVSLASPFIGGGSVELNCAANGIKVYASDAFNPLISFWRTVSSKHLGELCDAVEEIHRHATANEKNWDDFRKRVLPRYRKVMSGGVAWNGLTVIEEALYFYILNRCTYSGTTLSGGFRKSDNRFTASLINKLRKLETYDMEFECLDYEDALDKNTGRFFYLDPPYVGVKGLYGKNGDLSEFNHVRLADRLWRMDNWLLSYGDDPLIRYLYGGKKMLSLEWWYGGAGGKGQELLIFSD